MTSFNLWLYDETKDKEFIDGFAVVHTTDRDRSARIYARTLVKRFENDGYTVTHTRLSEKVRYGLSEPVWSEIAFDKDATESLTHKQFHSLCRQ